MLIQAEECYKEMTILLKDEEKFARTIKLWGKNLLDLSKRNPQLNFRPGRRNVVELLHPAFPKLFDLFASEAKSLRFIEVYRKKTRGELSQLSEERRELYREKLPLIHAEAIQSKIDAKIRGLVTNQFDDDLRQLLSRLKSKDERFISERGIHTLFLTFGVLTWYESTSSNIAVESPLLFVPVRLVQKRSNDSFYLESEDLGVSFNIALSEKFYRDFGLQFPVFEDDVTDLEEYFSELEVILSQIPDFKKRWSIIRKVYVHNFEFSKISLYKDLDEHKSQLYEHDIVRSLVLGKYFGKEFGIGLDEKELLTRRNLKQIYTILDADSSQLLSIEKALLGNSLIITGPPGTGKSQTIANLITEFLAFGKRVLFVAQKKVALDVVKKRLDDAGVGEFCLEVHSHKANKRQILNQLQQTMARVPVIPTIPSKTYAELTSTIERLNAYVKETGFIEIFDGDSLYELIGKVSALSGVPDVNFRIANLDSIGKIEYELILQSLDTLETHFEKLKTLDDNIFAENGLYLDSYSDENELSRIITKFYEQSSVVARQFSTYLSRISIKRGIDIEEVIDFSTSLKYITEEIKEVLHSVSKIQGEQLFFRLRSLSFLSRKGVFSKRAVIPKNIDKNRNNMGKARKNDVKPANNKTSKRHLDSSGSTSSVEDTEDIQADPSKLSDNLGDTSGSTEILSHSELIKVIHESYSKLNDFLQIDWYKNEPLIREILKYLDTYPRNIVKVKFPQVVKNYETKYQSWKKYFMPGFYKFNFLIKKKFARESWEDEIYTHARKFQKWKVESFPGNLTQLNFVLKAILSQFQRASNLGLSFNDLHLSSLREFQDKKVQRPDMSANVYDEVQDRTKQIVSIASIYTRLENRIKNLQEMYSLKVQFRYLLDKPMVARLDSMNSKTQELVSEIIKLESLYSEFSTVTSQFYNIPFTQVIEKKFLSLTRELYNSISELKMICQLKQAISQGERHLGEGFLEKYQQLANSKYPFKELFTKQFFSALIKQALAGSKVLSDTESQDELIDKFSVLDREVTKLNAYRVVKMLSGKTEDTGLLSSSLATSELGLLKREFTKKRRIKPLRRLFKECKNYITKVKPCFLMSPLSVANYLPGHEFDSFFDVIIFDEASQITVEDSVGTILRGKQLIVVGDLKQLPPTRFFTQSYEDDRSPDDEVPLESILAQCTGIGLVDVLLRWHYRSKKEGLIRFSNEKYYNGGLYTFPDATRNPDLNAVNILDAPAIAFVSVPGIYDRGKTSTNRIEAKQVVKIIVQHIEFCIQSKKHYSLGIIALNLKQAELIQDLLDLYNRQNPDFEKLFFNMQEHEEPLFIKNLEDVQGDERDVIYISIGYGKSANGKISANFGPINNAGGENRLNVAITRSRYHMKVFCSFLPAEIDGSKSSSIGLKHLLAFLEYAKSGVLKRSKSRKTSRKALFESPFEESVARQVEALGYKVDTQIGASGYRIDLGIVDPKDPNHYIAGIECDGASYHSSKTARDRDRSRREILANLGWKIYYIWSTDWFTDKREVLKSVDKFLKQATEGKEKAEYEGVSEDYEQESTKKVMGKTSKTASEKLEQSSDKVQHHESRFEEDVAEELETLGYCVDAQINVNGYRIDLAIVNPDDPNYYAVGIECDGATYHDSKEMRKKDKIRLQALEALGWYIYNIWSTDWFSNKGEVLKSLDVFIQKALKETQTKRKVRVAIDRVQKLTNMARKIRKIDHKADRKIKFEYKSIDNLGEKPDIFSETYRKGLLKMANIIEYRQFTRISHSTYTSYLMDFNAVRMVFNQIIQLEGPIHRKLLRKRLFKYFQVPRATKKVKEIFSRLADGTTNFFGELKNQGSVRISVNIKEDPRKFDHISPQEMKNAFKLILSATSRIEKKELFKQALSFFGIKRINKSYYKQLNATLQLVTQESENSQQLAEVVSRKN